MEQQERRWLDDPDGQSLTTEKPTGTVEEQEEDLSTEIVFEPLELELKQVKVDMGGQKMILLQASQGVQAQFKNKMFSGVRIDDEGKPKSLDGIGDAELHLLSLCLYRANPNGELALGRDGHPDPRGLVGIHTIRHWPGHVVERLHSILRKISRMDGEEKQKLQRAKNSLGATLGNSA